MVAILCACIIIQISSSEYAINPNVRVEFAGGVDPDVSHVSDLVQSDVVRVKEEHSSISSLFAAAQVPQPSTPLNGCLSQVVASLQSLQDDLESDEDDTVSSFSFPSQSRLISFSPFLSVL